MNGNRLTIGFAFGGKALEHEHSVKSALYLLANVDARRYDFRIFYLDRRGCLAGRAETADVLRAMLAEHGEEIFLPAEEPPADFTARLESSVAYAGPRPPDGFSLLRALADTETDVFFPVFHGQNGEDALIQGLFELCGKPYIGCGVLGSAVGNDKEMCKRILQQRGIPSTDFRSFGKKDWTADAGALARRLEAELGYPMFVKPVNLGSSIGVRRVLNRRELAAAVRTVLTMSERVLCEREVQGREYGIGIIGNGTPLLSEIVEFGGGGAFMDYEAKYGPQAVTDTIPAPLSGPLKDRLERLAAAAYQALDLCGMSRLDFFITRAGEVLFNEANTVPGFGRTSVFAKIWQAKGVPPSRLIDRLVDYGIERYERKRRMRYSSLEVGG